MGNLFQAVTFAQQLDIKCSSFRNYLKVYTYIIYFKRKPFNCCVQLHRHCPLLYFLFNLYWQVVQNHGTIVAVSGSNDMTKKKKKSKDEKVTLGRTVCSSKHFGERTTNEKKKIVQTEKRKHRKKETFTFCPTGCFSVPTTLTQSKNVKIYLWCYI